MTRPAFLSAPAKGHLCLRPMHNARHGLELVPISEGGKYSTPKDVPAALIEYTCYSGPVGLASKFKDQMTAVPHGHARHTAHAEHRAAKDLLKAAQTDPFKLSVKTIPLQDRTHQTNARPRLRIHVQTKQSRLQNQLPTHLARANPCDWTTQIPAIVPTAQ